MKEKIVDFWKKNWVVIINMYLILYAAINPDRIGTWVGHFLLNIKLILGEI